MGAPLDTAAPSDVGGVARLWSMNLDASTHCLIKTLMCFRELSNINHPMGCAPTRHRTLFKQMLVVSVANVGGGVRGGPKGATLKIDVHLIW